MAVSVTLPALGESVTEGTVTRWLKAEGERVEVDEPLLEVSTDKVDTEIPAPVAGILASIKVGEDETVEVGAELAVIDDGTGTPTPEPAPAAEPAPVTETAPAPVPAPAPAPVPAQALAPAPAPARTAAPAPVPFTPPAPAGDGGKAAYATPLVRKLAAELGVPLAAVQGTGIGGRIRRQDVLAAAEAPAPAAAPASPSAAPSAAPSPVPAGPSAAAAPSPLRGQTVPMTRVRKAIARHMVQSLQVSAQLTTVVEADVTRIIRLRELAMAGFREREGVKLSPLPFFVKAAVEALKLHPVLNARVNEDDTITYHDVENIGIAVETDRGLFVPVIHGAGDLSTAGIARRTADLAARTRDGGLKPDELAGGTFTVTNTGSRGALFDTPILNQPQVGMLGIGATVRRPVALETPEGTVVAVRDMVYLALSYDHRIVDGADAARFLGTVKARLEEGAFEADLGL
ncbi:2-oxoglutarate dehydrogenase, E2 component, dihydrolipoamide succinyltransferase [Kitasatospora sp. NBC_01539]|uniref:2-oxoglutarate dehydrogenase, E2 component, dihydrolipoamide succinyltransferase n=1 Tax=Kitasatospora sp. NBC_01539 TaxID=2903577 RepID=UPI0038601513